MKITDVTLTLFGWESIPSTIYGHHTARPTGKSDVNDGRCVGDRNQLPATLESSPSKKTQLLTKATGYELGVRSEPFPDHRVEAARFVLNLDSEATFSGNQAVTTPGRPSHRQGIELSASYISRFPGSGSMPISPPAGRVSPISTPARMTPSRGIPVITSRMPPMWSRRRTRLSRTSVLGSARFASAILAGAPLIEDGSVTSRPTTLADLRIGYKFKEKARVWLDILNLFKAHQIDYFYPSQLANETAPVYDIHFKPVESLSARLTFSPTF